MGGTTAEWSGSVAQKRGTFAGPCAGYCERGAATRNNRIPRPNVVTRRVSVERTARLPVKGEYVPTTATARWLWGHFSSRVRCTSCDS